MNEITLTGYVPGAIGKITELHAVYYHQHWGFDVSFEVQVGTELSEFVGNFQEKRDGLWLAWRGGTFAGSIAVDGRPIEPGAARLRWFIAPAAHRRAGVGMLLLQRAVNFCREKGYERLFLWTFRGLDPARRLYEGAGFQLREEHPVRQWGQEIREQRFDLELRGNHPRPPEHP